MAGPVIIKICTLCRRVQKYDKGDRLPHWGDLTLDERCAMYAKDIRWHHTICPDCHAKIRERDERLAPKEGSQGSRGQGSQDSRGQGSQWNTLEPFSSEGGTPC